MDDTEAEAVLVALGPKLEWTQVDDKRWDSNVLETRVFYTIVAEPSKRRFAVHQDVREDFDDDATGEIDWNPVFLSSLTAAQAACERHYVTGKWD